MKAEKSNFSVFEKNYLIAIILMIVCAVIIQFETETEQFQINPDIKIPLQINDWSGKNFELDQSSLNLIQPDFYLFREYQKQNDIINVYIGYYNNLDKSDLAHSPLVCYSGGGWEIKKKESVEISINNNNLDFELLIIKNSSSEHLVLYAFKTKDQIFSNRTKMRFQLIANKLLRKSTPNAFIRFSIEIENNDIDGAQRKITTFLTQFDFYVNKLFENI